MCQFREIEGSAKPIGGKGRLTLVKGDNDMRYINWDISSNAEKLVAFLLAVTVLFALV